MIRARSCPCNPRQARPPAAAGLDREEWWGNGRRKGLERYQAAGRSQRRGRQWRRPDEGDPRHQRGPRHQGQRAGGRPERPDQDPGLYFHLPSQARRHAAQSRPGRALQRFPAPAPGQDQPRRRALQLHLGHGRHHLLPVYRADLHRRAPDVLLPSQQGAGLPRRALSGSTTCPSASCCATCTAGLPT